MRTYIFEDYQNDKYGKFLPRGFFYLVIKARLGLILIIFNLKKEII